MVVDECQSVDVSLCSANDQNLSLADTHLRSQREALSRAGTTVMFCRIGLVGDEI